MKAVLVIDMPESCSKCKFMYEFYGVKKCQLLNILENGGKAIISTEKLTTERKYCCPLKPMLEADEIRNNAIEEFAEKANKKITEFVLEHKEQLVFASGVSVAWNIIDEIVEKMKGDKG